MKSLSRVRLLATPWTAAYQALPSMGFSRQQYWSGVPLSSPYTILEVGNGGEWVERILKEARLKGYFFVNFYFILQYS